jgi:AraC-like DNA-binding protein
LIPEEISITSVDEKLMKKTIDFINDHISDSDLTVEKVAGEVGLSRVHFYRKIKALTNLSAVEFIRLIRLERAAQLLNTCKLNVSEVRYAVGIQDPEYFRKTFKEHFGQAPSDYAKRNDPSSGPENVDL